MNFKAVLALPKTARSAQTYKSIRFIWIVWSTLYVYLWMKSKKPIFFPLIRSGIQLYALGFEFRGTLIRQIELFPFPFYWLSRAGSLFKLDFFFVKSISAVLEFSRIELEALAFELIFNFFTLLINWGYVVIWHNIWGNNQSEKVSEIMSHLIDSPNSAGQFTKLFRQPEKELRMIFLVKLRSED